MGYDRKRAVGYAHLWAFERNPAWGVFDEMGGDCTNFVSQCLYAGCGQMNFTPVHGWYYEALSRRAPAWTGVAELYRFLTHNQGPGPFGESRPLAFTQPGDAVFLALEKNRLSHAGLVVSAGPAPTPENVRIAAHTRDSDNRPLASYPYQRLILVHIAGSREG